MKNMGPKSREWLASVGVYTLDDVAKLGVVETYKRVKAAYPEKVSLRITGRIAGPAMERIAAGYQD